MSTATVVIDMGDWFNLLDQMANAPFEALQAMEQALEVTFNMTQDQVHVDTGSLRGSGKTESDIDGGVWVGTIEYGGEAPGQTNNPVVYAHYERRRGGDHDFLAGTEELEGLMLEAMTNWLGGA